MDAMVNTHLVHLPFSEKTDTIESYVFLVNSKDRY